MDVLLIKAITFALPCWIANISFSLVEPIKRCVPFLNKIDRPIDFGLSFASQRLFGDNRRLMSVGVLFVVCSVWLLLGGSMSDCLKMLATFGGTHLGSFVKRRLRFAPGEMFPIWDQLDYMFLVGPIWFFSGLVELDTLSVALFITLIGQPLVSLIGYIAKLKDKPY